MKRILKKGLICITILFLILNFVTINVAHAADQGTTLGNLFSGLIGLCTWIPRALILACAFAVNGLVSAFTHLGMGEIQGFGSLGSNIFVNPYHIFFNKIPLLDVNFFNFDGLKQSGTIYIFRTAVAGWYYTMRLLACMALAVILIYIGIRMAISTIASEKAMYKKMLVDWVTSLALLFLLHYIMIFTFACNEALVNALANICSEMDLTGFMGDLFTQALGIDVISAVSALAIYCLCIYYTVSFLFAYVKRMLTIGFLIMIAPLITITYSIDKIGDQKAQALNTWLKEFIYNILIQPFHCILFAAFASVAYQVAGVGLSGDTSIAGMILAICCIKFIKTGEDIVKNIFGFSKASSITDVAKGAAMAGAAMKFGGKAAGAAGAGAAKAKNLISQHGNKVSKAAGSLSSKVGSTANKISNSLSKVNKDGTLTKRGEKIAKKEATKQTQSQRKSGQTADYDANLQKITTDMTQKFTAKQEKLSEKAAKKASKKEEKATRAQAKAETKAKDKEKAIEDDKNSRAEKLAKQRYGDNATAEQKAKCREEIDKKDKEKEEDKANRKQKAKNITGAVGKYISTTGAKASKNSLAVAAALIGGGEGIAGALAGYNMGSNFMKGYYANLDSTVQQNMSGAVQGYMNMHPGANMGDATQAIYDRKQNGGYDLNKTLNDILKTLQELKINKNTRQNIVNSINAKSLQDPSGLNDEFIKKVLADNNVNGSVGEEAFDKLHDFTSTLTEIRMADTIESTMKTTNRSIDNITNMAINITNNISQEGASAADVNRLNQEVRRANDATNSANASVQQLNNQAEDLKKQVQQSNSNNN